MTIPLPEDYIDSICELRTLNNKLLGVGKINETTLDYIQIKPADDDDDLPLISYNTKVKVQIFNSKLGTRVVTGSTYLSGEDLLKLVELHLVMDKERRGFFRIITNFYGKLYPPFDEEENRKALIEHDLPEDSKINIAKPIPVKITDMSLSGICFESSRLLYLGDVVEIVFKIEDKTLRVHCVIRRWSNRDYGLKSYGSEYQRISQNDTDLVCKFLFSKQAKTIRI